MNLRKYPLSDVWTMRVCVSVCDAVMWGWRKLDFFMNEMKRIEYESRIWCLYGEQCVRIPPFFSDLTSHSDAHSPNEHQPKQHFLLCVNKYKFSEPQRLWTP